MPPTPADARAWSPWATLPAYAALYCLLDWVSFIQPMGNTGITPWNPQWALAVAMMTRAPHMARTVAVTLLCAAVQPALRHSPAAELVASSVEVLADAAIAIALRHWLGRAPVLATRRDYAAFMGVVAVGAALQSALYAVVLAGVGGGGGAGGGAVTVTGGWDTIGPALVSGWVGAVNLVVALPLIFALADRDARAELAAMARTPEWWAIALLATAFAHMVFVRSMGDEFKHFYLLFLPVGWAAARFGHAGAVGSATLVQLLLVLAVQSLPYQPRTVFELHLLLMVLGATSLLVGTIIRERQQAEAALRASLDAAAAADMAAALAHELNQPLTSLVSYARATQLLVARLERQHRGTGGTAGTPASEDTQAIAEVSHKLAHEALRAGEVVKRLRDFFRRRGTQLQPTDIGTLIDEVMEAHAARADLAGVLLAGARPAVLPPVLIDRVQVGVVLRNLVANALEAATLEGGPGPRVQVDAVARGHGVVVSVVDTGAGIPAGRTHRVFDDRRSSKAGGMGIGLAISRSIIQAHDGRLWAEPGPGGRFFFTLPLAPPAEASDTEALEVAGHADADADANAHAA